MKTFLDTIDSIRKYNKNLPTKENGLSIVKYGDGIKSFEKQLSDGEVFEHYLVQLINENTDRFAIKIPFVNIMHNNYMGSLYQKFNHVDIAVYASKDADVYNDTPTTLIDCKIQCRTFMKAKELVGILPEKCVIVNKEAMDWYRKNNITTMLAVYMANGLTKEGVYVADVKNVSEKLFQVGYVQYTGSLKANLNTDEMHYFDTVSAFVDKFN